MAPHSSTLAWKIPWTGGAWWAAVHGVAKSWTQLSDFTFTFHFYALEKEMATHSSVLAWRIPGTGEPDGLLSMRSHRVGHDWSDLAAASYYMYILCIPHFLYPLIYWWTLRLLQYLVYVNNVAMNIDIHISFRISVFTDGHLGCFNILSM